MASACIQSCVADARVPVRATYVNLYKWPESDAEFIKSVKSNSRMRRDRVGGCEFNHPRVVDGISCRQLYLRSYTFSRKETLPEKTEKRLNKVKVKKYTALMSMFCRFLSCTTKVDVADH
ncbi:hypothetical protein RJ641_032984 [Dillenia turbinata]|uniref:Uncharacterized protein n=1 Tax=Dillenia turbinata TaxID=194707 RepID=A0AAN8ZCX6_9MAGN